MEITGGAQSVSDLIREEAAVGLHLESTFLNWVSSLLLTSPLRSQCHLPSIPRHLILFCYFVSLSLLRLLTIITLPTSCQADSIANTRVEIVALLHGLRAAGKTIAAYGAPAKATTLMYHFNLTSDVIKYIIDDNPLKQGLFSPGLHVPVVQCETLYADRPDYLLILAWNFAPSIMKKHEKFLHGGGRFIVPLPEVRVVKDLS